jgi:hypothetical protein
MPELFGVGTRRAQRIEASLRAVDVALKQTGGQERDALEQAKAALSNELFR